MVSEPWFSTSVLRFSSFYLSLSIFRHLLYFLSTRNLLGFKIWKHHCVPRQILRSEKSRTSPKATTRAPRSHSRDYASDLRTEVLPRAYTRARCVSATRVSSTRATARQIHSRRVIHTHSVRDLKCASTACQLSKSMFLSIFSLLIRFSHSVFSISASLLLLFLFLHYFL